MDTGVCGRVVQRRRWQWAREEAKVVQRQWWRRAREMAGKINEGGIWAREAAREIRLVGRWGCGWEQVRMHVGQRAR